jgi:hypothetical protein
MKKILYLLAFILILTSPALAGESYKVGLGTGSYYDQQRDRWSTWQIRVYVYHDPNILFDDFTYISSGKGKMKASGLLLEKGRPGAANTSRLKERKRMVETLEKIRPWMNTATDEQIKATREQGHFTNFLLEMAPNKKVGKVLLRMQIRDVNTNKRLVLYLDKAQVKQLTALIKNVPSVLDDMAEE